MAGDDGRPAAYFAPVTAMQELWEKGVSAHGLTAAGGDTLTGQTLVYTPDGMLALAATAANVPERHPDAATGSSALFGTTQTGHLVGLVFDGVSAVRPPGWSEDGPEEYDVRVALHMTAPLQMPGPVTFTFRVNSNGVVPLNVDTTAALEAAGADIGIGTIWCVTKNGGAVLLPALVKCLPTVLTLNPAAIVACVLGALPGVAVETVKRVISECFS